MCEGVWMVVVILCLCVFVQIAHLTHYEEVSSTY